MRVLRDDCCLVRGRNTIYARSDDCAACHAHRQEHLSYDRTQTGCPLSDNHPFCLRVGKRPDRSRSYVYSVRATAIGSREHGSRSRHAQRGRERKHQLDVPNRLEYWCRDGHIHGELLIGWTEQDGNCALHRPVNQPNHAQSLH